MPGLAIKKPNEGRDRNFERGEHGSAFRVASLPLFESRERLGEKLNADENLLFSRPSVPSAARANSQPDIETFPVKKFCQNKLRS